MMKAAAIASFGPPEVLQITEIDNPQAGPGQIRVRVKAAGVQPYDWAVRKGWAPPAVDIRFPQILGNEFAGIVDQVGEGVEQFRVGSEVLGWSLLSCYAEFVVVHADQAVTKPPQLPWEEAGGMSASGQTAHTALQVLVVGEGDTVLVHAAAGGVGSLAVQLAKAWGATVIGTASERNHEYLRSLGAIPVAYGDGLVDRVRKLAPDGVDVALDAIGGGALQASIQLVNNRDRIGTLVDFDQGQQLGIQLIRSQRSAARLAELVELYVQGKLRVPVSKTFPISDAASAHRESETGHVRGKIVLLLD